jgi:hypothetical protein
MRARASARGFAALATFRRPLARGVNALLRFREIRGLGSSGPGNVPDVVVIDQLGFSVDNKPAARPQALGHEYPESTGADNASGSNVEHLGFVSTGNRRLRRTGHSPPGNTRIAHCRSRFSNPQHASSCNPPAREQIDHGYAKSVAPPLVAPGDGRAEMLLGLSAT